MSHETITSNRRIYLTVAPAPSGRYTLKVSYAPPAIGEAMVALISRGLLMDGAELALELVSDPKADPELGGPAGDNGWTPVLVAEADGTRTLVRVEDWVRAAGKPATGYLTASGALATTKSAAFNFNALKRVDIFGAVTGADGVATVTFAPEFGAVPAKALPLAANNLLGGIVTAEIVAGSLTKAGCRVRVTQKALVTGVVSAIAGTSVSLIAIEA